MYAKSKAIAVCCSVLQCVTVCCSVLQCVAVCCNTLQCGSRVYVRSRAAISIMSVLFGFSDRTVHCGTSGI